MPAKNHKTKRARTKYPRIQEAKSILNGWRSCKTDREKHRFVEQLRKTRPEMATRFSQLLQET